ncbi:hypothetical protein F4777DRAFT_581165 [Nemania sp. FL0916]|nr:hypothetical protein F4777DRAFT_581165 [Nemania sp. FL0916]
MEPCYKAVPISSLLNPTGEVSLSQIPQPAPRAPSADLAHPRDAVPDSIAVHLSNPTLTGDGSRDQSLNPAEEQPRVALHNVPIPSIENEDQYEYPSHDLVITGNPATEAEVALAKRIADMIAEGLQSNVLAPRAIFGRSLNKDLLPAQMAETLWTRSRFFLDPKPVRWVNRFYSSCMRQILRKRGVIPHIPKRQSADPSLEYKDRSATATEIINVVADKLGTGVYAGLAIKGPPLCRLFPVRGHRPAVLTGLLIAELEKRPGLKLATKTIRGPAPVISTLWNEPYASICRELQLHNTGKQPFPPVPVFVFENLPECNKAAEPGISEGLRTKLRRVVIEDIKQRRKTRFVPQQYRPYQTGSPVPRMYFITCWTTDLTPIRLEIEKELSLAVKKSFTEPLRRRTEVVLIEDGSMCGDKRACVNYIVPIRLSLPHYRPKVQFDLGPDTQVMIKDWLSLPLTIIEGEARIGGVDDILVFFWFRWYKKQYWDLMYQNFWEGVTDCDETTG